MTMLHEADIAPPQPGPEGGPMPVSISANNWVPHDIVLRDAWFPLAHAPQVTKKPLRRAVFSQPYYIWREDGQAVASEFHPGVEPDRDPGAFTGATGRYPVAERYGYIWGWYGNPAAADLLHLPNIPYLPPEGGLPGHMIGTVRYDCAAALTLENLIDLSHADILHADTIGDEKSESEEIEVSSTAETVTMIRHCHKKSVAPLMRWFGGVRAQTQEVRQVIHIYARSHCALIYGRFRPGFDVPVFHPSLPETRDRTRQDVAFNLTLCKSPFRYALPKAGYYISSQDNRMTAPQSARYAWPIKRRDLHSRHDAAGQRYRLLMQQIAARQATGDFSYGEVLSRDTSALLGIEPGLYRF
jgi:hypothetical protein